MKLKKLTLVAIVALLLLQSCSTTTPMLGYSGSSYNSISDDLLLYNSLNRAVDEMSSKIPISTRLLVVQVINDPTNDFITERVLESLIQRGYLTAKVKDSQLQTIDLTLFDRILIVYPSVFGIETAATRPTRVTTNILPLIPIVGQVIAPAIIEANTYDDRLGAVNLNCRLVDAKTGSIEWVAVFSGTDKRRLTKGNILNILATGI